MKANYTSKAVAVAESAATVAAAAVTKCKQCELHLKYKPICCKGNCNVAFGLRSCTIYYRSPICTNDVCIKPEDIQVLFNETRALIRTLMSVGVNVYGLHISYTPGEHLHSWIHTHSPEMSKIANGRLQNPLDDKDPLVLQGADVIVGTKLPDNLQSEMTRRKTFKDGGKDSHPWSTDSTRSVDIKSLCQELEIFLLRDVPKMFYLFWYTAKSDEIIISYQES